MADRTPRSPDDMADDKRVRLHRASGLAGRSHGVGCMLAAFIAVVPAALYFGLFAVLIVDELVLKTRYLSPGNLPGNMGDWLETIYHPLIVLFHVVTEGKPR